MSAQSAANVPHLPHVDGRTRHARRRKQLLEAYTAALGGRQGLSAAQLEAVQRAAELQVLAEAQRQRLLQDDLSSPDAVAALVKIEGVADRAVRQLGIKPGTPPQPQTLAQYLAQRAARPAGAPSDEAAA